LDKGAQMKNWQQAREAHKIRTVTGYSVGDVAAWGVAGLPSPAEALDVVACRAEAMDAASPRGDSLQFCNDDLQVIPF
jgi:acyl transferase domain-containing protein